MSEAFSSVADQMIGDLTQSNEGSSQSQERNVQQQTDQGSPQARHDQQDASRQQTAREVQAIIELDKLEKFKYQGKEWSLKDLEKAMLRQQDYTKKTTSLADERKGFEQNKKFHENLAADLWLVKQNPRMAEQFIKTYPKEFHQYLNWAVAQENQAQAQNGQQSQQQQQSSQQPDVQLMSRLNTLENFYNEQQISKNEVQLNKMLDAAQKAHPTALPDLALARLYELHSSGTAVTQDLVDQVYKQSAEQIDAIVKARYGDMVKKQTEANNKSRGDGKGGGVPGQAPKKFKNFREVTDFAVNDLTRKS